MLHPKYHFSLCAAFIAVVSTLATPGNAKTVEVDGTNFTTLSAAVAEAYSDALPAIVNLNVSSLPTADGQIVLDKPIIINGNANARPAPNNYCDILADMATLNLLATVDQGAVGKSYIDILSTGIVTLNYLKIHPNADGGNHAITVPANSNRIVAAIRMAKPVSNIGNYTLNHVLVSASDKLNAHAFVPMDTGADLYTRAGIEKWSSLNGTSQPNIALYGVVQLDNLGGAGTYNAVLDHCTAGVTMGTALNINSTGGTTLVKGGVYGHSGRNGIRVLGNGVTLQGTHDDRLRVLRSTNISANNSHVVLITGDVTLMEYVDAAGVNTANCFSLTGGHTTMMRYCRGLGKFGVGTNESLFINNKGTVVDSIEDSTFVGTNSNYNPANIASNYEGAIAVKNCIFTSENLGTVFMGTTATVSFSNCALPTDNYLGESLATPPIPVVPASATFTPPYTNAPYNESPHYMLTSADYDWSDAQGAGKTVTVGSSVINIGAGNANILRPTNPNYQNAAVDTTDNVTTRRLNGGAGTPAAGIDPSEWMLM